MADDAHPERLICRADIVLFFVLLVSFGWFGHSNPGWNVNSRMVLSLALAETGHANVERYVVRPGLETQDLSRYAGHLYSDKSIGTSLMGVPAVWAVQGMEALTGTTFPTLARTWLITFLTVGLSGALAGVLLRRWLQLIWPRENLGAVAATFLAAAVMLGSLLFLYGTLFMSYLPATLFLLAALLALERAIAEARQTGGSGSPAGSDEHSLNAGRAFRLFFVAGFLGGLCVLCEYFYAAAVGLMAIYAAGSVGWRRTLSPWIAYALGGLIGIAPFLYYTITIFGRPAIPYEFHLVPEFRLAMSQGLMGATWPPKLSVVWLVTFHPFRGLFFYSPVLVLGLAGLIRMVTSIKGRAALGWLCLANVVFYVSFNAAYYMWWGGWSFAPRLLAPAVPFLAAGLGAWSRQRWGRWMLGATASIGVMVHLLVNATEPQVPDGGWQIALLRPRLAQYDYPSVFMQSIWPRLQAGAFERNLGHVMGLNGYWSLVPLIAIWAVAGWMILRRPPAHDNTAGI